MKNIAVLAALAALLAVPLAAQNLGRYTLGVQFAYLNTLQPAAPSASLIAEGASFGTCHCGYPGIGVRFTAHLAGALGLDAEFDVLPGEGPASAKASIKEILVGPRFRIGSGHIFKVYAYLRPGWLFLHSPAAYIGIPGVAFFPNSEDDFVLNPGLTIALPISRHWLGRLDIGDLLITGSGCSNCAGGVTPLPSNNLQAAVGLAYRF